MRFKYMSRNIMIRWQFWRRHKYEKRRFWSRFGMCYYVGSFSDKMNIKNDLFGGILGYVLFRIRRTFFTVHMQHDEDENRILHAQYLLIELTTISFQNSKFELS